MGLFLKPQNQSQPYGPLHSYYYATLIHSITVDAEAWTGSSEQPRCIPPPATSTKITGEAGGTDRLWDEGNRSCQIGHANTHSSYTMEEDRCVCVWFGKINNYSFNFNTIYCIVGKFWIGGSSLVNLSNIVKLTAWYKHTCTMMLAFSSPAPTSVYFRILLKRGQTSSTKNQPGGQQHIKRWGRQFGGGGKLIPREGKSTL